MSPEFRATGRGGQQILAAVGVAFARRRVGREIALGIMGGRRPADAGQLVEAVGWEKAAREAASTTWRRAASRDIWTAESRRGEGGR